MSRVSFSPPAPAPLPPLLSLPARKMRLGNGEERSLFLMHHRAEIPSLSFVLFRSRPSSLPSSSISHFRFGLLFSFSPLSRLFLFSFLPPPVFAPPGSRRDGGGPAGDGAPGAPAREIPEDSGGGLGGNGGVGRDDNKQYVAAIFILSHATAVHEYILIPFSFFCFCFLPHSLLL